MIPKHLKTNFETLLKAVKADDVCLLEMQDKLTKLPVYAICTINYEGTDRSIAPVAIMIDGNPYELFNPPNPKGGFEEV